MASTQYGFGGVVYVYTENKVMVWRPSDTASKGNIINIGERWGNGNAHQSSETAVVIIRVIRLKPRGVCPVPPQGQNASCNEYDNHPGLSGTSTGTKCIIQ
ncbi:Hypothetical predicted protein [Mytilus galloprovincialis]|uniref:Uncharacterized protein n=1 Tax=Mytilus galloprovincialis TaxID=29158 RepID=A0A8B6F6F1_MYTGA|nr:Hypothetical predicted protein [Mytilus galloprovincialis]